MRELFNVKVVVAGMVFAIFLLATFLTFLWYAQDIEPPNGQTTAVFLVIPAPSITPPQPIPSPTSLSTPTASAPVPPPPGGIAVGALVQVTGTEGSGLRLRSSPSLAGDVLFIAIDSEVYQVMEGPQGVDGYQWWRLQNPYDATVQGWAVANYLVVVQNP